MILQCISNSSRLLLGLAFPSHHVRDVLLWLFDHVPSDYSRNQSYKKYQQHCILLFIPDLGPSSQRVGLSPTGGILSFKYFSTSSISSGNAECSNPLYIFKSTFQPFFPR